MLYIHLSHFKATQAPEIKKSTNYLQKLQWRHNGHDSVSNHQPYDCLLNRLFRRRSKKISKLRVTGLCSGNSPGTGEFPAQMTSNAENVSIWWRHHESTVTWNKVSSVLMHNLVSRLGLCIEWQSSCRSVECWWILASRIVNAAVIGWPHFSLRL